MVSTADFKIQQTRVDSWVGTYYALFCQLYNAELLPKCDMNSYKGQMIHSITFDIELSSKSVGVRGKFCSPERKSLVTPVFRPFF